MNDFIYHIPTKVYFGKDQLHHLGEELKQYGTRMLMTYGDHATLRVIPGVNHTITIHRKEVVRYAVNFFRQLFGK